MSSPEFPGGRIRHSGATRVEITVKIEGRRVWVSLRDNGRGFDLSSSQHTGGDAHLRRIYHKLGVHTRVALAMRQHLV